MEEPTEQVTFDELVASRTSDAALLLRDLAFAAVRGTKGLMNVWTVLTDGRTPLNAIARAGHVSGTAVSPIGLGEVLRVDGPDDPFAVVAWPSGSEGVFLLVSAIAWTDRRWVKFSRWVANAAPAVAQCYLNEADFDAIGEALGEGGRVEVSRATARDIYDRHAHNDSWSTQRQQRPTYSQVMSGYADVAAVHTLTLHVGENLNLLLRRTGSATYYGGSFDLFDKVVIGRLVGAASRRRALLTDRARGPDKPAMAPIVIRLPGPTLADPDAISDLIDSMAAPSGLGVAVLHRNPYLHVAVTDYRDGSNFDVFVTAPDEISIHPGFTASLGALSQFSQSVGEQLTANEIAEAEPRPPVTLEELLATG